MPSSVASGTPCITDFGKSTERIVDWKDMSKVWATLHVLTVKMENTIFWQARPLTFYRQYDTSLYENIPKFRCYEIKTIPVAARSKLWVSGWNCGYDSRRSHECLSEVLCVVRERALRRADHWYSGVLPSVVCLNVIVNPR